LGTEEINTSRRDLSFEEFARLVLDTVEATEIEYLIGGAVAVWAYAEPRTTRDFDVLINLPAKSIKRLSEELEKRDMLVPPEVIVDILMMPEGDLPLNAIHLYSGYKADLFLLRPGDVYKTASLARRRLVNLGPLGDVYAHSPEDLVINKVHYYGISQQTKHLRDIASILTYVEDFDFGYLNHWIDRLGLTPIWWELLREVDELLARRRGQQGTNA
jgi:hypothetical protein